MEIAIISGKGGTGKSSISAAVATLENKKVVLADCDVDAANLYLIFHPSHEEEEIYVSGHKAVIDPELCNNCGYCIDFCRFQAISYGEEKVIISAIECEGCFLCSRVCPRAAITMVKNDKSRMYSGNFRNGKMVYGRLAPGEENSGRLVSMVRERAKEIARENNLDTVIIDGPPGIGCPVISAITGVSRAVIVTEPTLSGLQDMKRALEVVNKFRIKASVIINKSDLNPDVTMKIQSWCRQNNIYVAGELNFDPIIVEAMIQGKSIVEHAPDSYPGKKITEIWNNILNHD